MTRQIRGRNPSPSEDTVTPNKGTIVPDPNCSIVGDTVELFSWKVLVNHPLVNKDKLVVKMLTCMADNEELFTVESEVDGEDHVYLTNTKDNYKFLTAEDITTKFYDLPVKGWYVRVAKFYGTLTEDRLTDKIKELTGESISITYFNNGYCQEPEYYYIGLDREGGIVKTRTEPNDLIDVTDFFLCEWYHDY